MPTCNVCKDWNAAFRFSRNEERQRLLIDTYLDRHNKIIVRYISVNNFHVEFLLLIDTCIWIHLPELLIDTYYVNNRYLDTFMRVIDRYIYVYLEIFSMVIDRYINHCQVKFKFINIPKTNAFRKFLLEQILIIFVIQSKQLSRLFNENWDNPVHFVCVV